MPFLKWAGVGLRQPHYQQVLKEKPSLALIEVHSENFMMDGGPSLQLLEQIRQQYPLSLHGVGLALGSFEPIPLEHLQKIKRLAEHFDPLLISDHLSWGRVNGIHLNDLLPIPYTKESLNHVCDQIDQIQSFLNRRFVIENISAYLNYVNNDFSEPDFINLVCQRTGCQLLLDINNIFVNANNFSFDPFQWIQSIHPQHVVQYHLAGHSHTEQGWIDTHGTSVLPDVWDLFKQTVQLFGPMPTIIERDQHIPSWHDLYQEVQHAEEIMSLESYF